ncbi:hypothetical protein ACFFIX_20420 [Metabacillus herbersteinensis]|uniref:DUF4253 domain-containing protein n=1 Tax=Metabacillus herbersteinensis TaxID=283816 RepID=A0ABV6GJ81_9BACI
MEMDIYEKSSLEASIGNLIMIKVFHDAGVDVMNFSNNSFMVDIQYNTDEGFSIFLEGLTSLFCNVSYYDYGEIEDSDDLKNMISDGIPEAAYLIQDPIFNKVLDSKYSEEFKLIMRDESNSFEHLEGEIIELLNKDGIAVMIWWPGMLYEVALSLINLKRKANELIHLLESEDNGILNQDNRQIA